MRGDSMKVALPLLLLTVAAHAAPVRVCIVGNSISEGFYPATHGYSEPLAALHHGEDFAIKNVAVAGTKAEAFQAAYETECKGRGYTHIIIGGPTNNLPDGTSAADIYAVINSIATEAESDTSARRQGSHVLLLAILPRGTGASWSTDLGTRLLGYNALAAARTGSTYVDTYTPMVEPASSPPALALAYGGATDGLHPDNAGQTELAALVNEAATAAGLW